MLNLNLNIYNSILWRHFIVSSIIALGLILFGVICLLHQFDDQLTDHFKQYKSIGNTQCPLLNEPLAQAALSRMRSPQCKLMMEHRLCSMANLQYWPINEINNTCTDYFDTKLQSHNVGCFRDSRTDRLLNGFRYNFSSTNSLESCLQNCLRAGFQLAGVEFGVECFCGDGSHEKHFADRQIDDSNCREHICPGDNSKFCGGFNAIQVMRTGVKGKHTQNLPKFQQIHQNIELTNVKILFLFQLNGRNARQIRRLFRMIYTYAHLYLVHVDRRQQYLHREMEKIQLELEARGQRNFRVIQQQRKATIWGGTSLLELFLTAISETLAKPANTQAGEWQKWDFVVNLSEADMPLLSLEELEANLAATPGKSYLSSHGYNTALFLQKQGFNFHFMECEERMWRVANRVNFPRNIRLDGGSDWLVVHRDLAEFALSSYAGLVPQIRLFFTSILLPLESFFHMLALNSANFCQRIIHQNFRFTNWRRKQGCRCGALKHVVDWCGCSPLAFRGNEAAQRIPIQICQEKRQFFGRKFDSLLHNQPIAFVERQSLRFRPAAELISQYDESFDSTWINLFSAETPYASPFASKLPLLNAILNSLLTTNKSIKNLNCISQRLLQIHVYKAKSSTAKIQSLFRVEVECQPQILLQIELLLTPIHENRIMMDNNIWNKDENWLLSRADDGDQGIISVEYGIGFDVKEEIFRTNPPIIHSANEEIFTLKWHWTKKMAMEMVGETTSTFSNWTSPAVHLELYGPNVDGQKEEQNRLRMEGNHSIGQYDSIWGNQFVQIQMPKNANPVFNFYIHKRYTQLNRAGQDALNGTWKTALFTSNGQQRLKIAETHFPIFPAFLGDNNQQNAMKNQIIIDRLLQRHFRLDGICIISNGEKKFLIAQFILNECQRQSWSSVFPDPKSNFPI